TTSKISSGIQNQKLGRAPHSMRAEVELRNGSLIPTARAERRPLPRHKSVSSQRQSRRIGMILSARRIREPPHVGSYSNARTVLKNLHAGCCCVRQCNEPKPSTRS